MADRLRELGFELDDAAIRAHAGALGRPHLADAVLAHPANAERLRDGGDRRQERAVPAPTWCPGAPGYVRRSRPTVAEAIDVIHAAGGRGGVGAPVLGRRRPDEALATLREFAAAGLDGVEALLRHPHGGADAALHDAAPRARAADDRLDRLPRAGARADFTLPRRSTFTI